MLRKILIISLILLDTCLSVASSRYQSSVTLNDGLPSNNIHQIFSDSRNIVWLATDAGLFEFDGGKVIIRKELEHLYGEKVISICEDSKSNLWLAATNIGLCLFDGHEIKIYDKEKLALKTEIQTVYFDSKHDKLIIGTSEGAYTVSIDDLDKLQLTPFESDRIINISAFVQNNEQFCAVSQNFDEVYHCNIATSQLKRLKRDDYLPVIEFNQFHTSELQNDLALKKEAFKIRNEHEGDINCEIIQIEETVDETFYLLRYFISDIEFRKVLRVSGRIVEDFSKSNNIDDVFVQSIFVDQDENNIWLGTKEKGIVHFQNSIFQYFNASYFQLDKLNIVDIESDDKGYIYIATNKEIIYFKENKIQKRISTSELCTTKEGSPSAVCENEIQIFDILNDGQSKLWLATNMGFYTLNLKNDAIKYVGIGPAKKFIFTKNKQLCFLWKNDFFVFDGKKFQNKIFSHKLSETTNVEVSKIVSRNSQVWLSTKQMGLFKYEAGEINQFHKDNSEIHNVINDLLLLPDGNMIAGGNNGNIYKLRYENNKLHILGIIDHKLGLTGTSIQGFQFLNDGSLWCGTNEGVFRFNYQTWKSDSTIDYRFWNHTKGYYDRSGKNSIVDHEQNIWVKTNTQLLKITNSLINQFEKSSCNLNLKNIQVYNRDWQPDSSKINIWTNKISGPIDLSHNQNYLTFNFGFQNCLNPGKSIFRYQLKEFDSKWSEWSTNRQAIYSNLPSGKYTLKVQGKHLNKVNIIPLSIEISIAYPWWKKPWFYAITFAILVGLIIASMRIYTRKIRKEEEERSKINASILDLKMKTLQNQLDPHFIFNALNSIQGYILEQETENALDYLSDFSTVLRKNINNADKDYISLSDEIAYLKHYVKLEQMRFMDRFIFEIVMNKNINPYNYCIPPMLIQPFIESAIKFGISGCKGDGLILINFDLEDNSYIRCTIEDNGIGRSKSKEFDAESRKLSHNKTMDIIQERITLLNKINNSNLKYDYKIFDLYDETQNPVGTKVEIGLPFQRTDSKIS
ncbi:histidine kinase [Ancylomarina sp. DW003]|nr:sensor histidine kinase [Ancylomarina sp. DW003]MDE5421734.1 histidine kinase [Ancylomarina sp. DW003]